MQDKVTFEYAIIRLVPKVEREEFFNVGVILFSKRKKFLDIKYHINTDKLKAFATEIELETLKNDRGISYNKKIFWSRGKIFRTWPYTIEKTCQKN